VSERLSQIWSEIEARTKKLDKALDHADAIDCLLAEARKLCGSDEEFEKQKAANCPKFSASWEFKLKAIREGRATKEELDAKNRAAVAKHRAKKKGAESLTSDVRESDTVQLKLIEPEPQANDAEASAEQRKAENAKLW
jgi:hypothetical protein